MQQPGQGTPVPAPVETGPAQAVELPQCFAAEQTEQEQAQALADLQALQSDGLHVCWPRLSAVARSTGATGLRSKLQRPGAVVHATEVPASLAEGQSEEEQAQAFDDLWAMQRDGLHVCWPRGRRGM